MSGSVLKFIIAAVVTVLLYGCVLASTEEFQRAMVGKSKRTIEATLGEPVFCKPDTEGEVCEWRVYETKFNDYVIYRVYFDHYGKCLTNSARFE